MCLILIWLSLSFFLGIFRCLVDQLENNSPEFSGVITTMCSFVDFINLSLDKQKSSNEKPIVYNTVIFTNIEKGIRDSFNIMSNR